MEFVISSLILCSIFLAATILAGKSLFKSLEQAASDQIKLAKLQTDTIKHLSNLLATKDPMAFQQVQTVTVEPETRYTGPYLSGDEIELLEQQEKQLEESWRQLAEDMENGRNE